MSSPRLAGYAAADHRWNVPPSLPLHFKSFLDRAEFHWFKDSLPQMLEDPVSHVPSASQAINHLSQLHLTKRQNRYQFIRVQEQKPLFQRVSPFLRDLNQHTFRRNNIQELHRAVLLPACTLVSYTPIPTDLIAFDGFACVYTVLFILI